MHVNMYLIIDLICVYAVSCVSSRVTLQKNTGTHPANTYYYASSMCKLNRIRSKLIQVFNQ